MKQLSEADITEILVQSRDNNARLGLTGALLFDRGRFIQIIEGPEMEMLNKFRSISRDPRHGNLHVVSREPIDKRQFPHWTMGFHTASEASMRQLDGFDDYFSRTSLIRIAHADPAAQLFLEWLGEYWFHPH